jgi:hypothetical protein
VRIRKSVFILHQKSSSFIADGKMGRGKTNCLNLNDLMDKNRSIIKTLELKRVLAVYFRVNRTVHLLDTRRKEGFTH